MTISSRTPEGDPNRCPVCRKRLRLSPSWPTFDAPCPHCGSLVWFPAKEPIPPSPKLTPAAELTLDDYRKQMLRAWKFGDMWEIMAQALVVSDMNSKETVCEKAFRRVLGFIDSMTGEERKNPEIIDAHRCQRIAVGSGAQTDEIEQFLAGYTQVRSMFRKLRVLGSCEPGLV